jgi:uridylate kinase
MTLRVGVLILKNNHIGVFIFNLLIKNQLSNNKLKIILLVVSISKERVYLAKIGIMSSKVNHHILHLLLKLLSWKVNIQTSIKLVQG